MDPWMGQADTNISFTRKPRSERHCNRPKATEQAGAAEWNLELSSDLQMRVIYSVIQQIVAKYLLVLDAG